MKHHGRATVIGDTTKGMAHPVALYPVESLGIQVQVPFGRPISSITGTSWEGVGVIPDVPVPSEQAFDRAYLMALNDLLETARDEDIRNQLEWAYVGQSAKVNPVKLSKSALRGLAGKYGNATIVYQNDRLFYHSSSGTEYELVPMTTTVFAFADDDEARIEFLTDPGGDVTELQIVLYDGYVISKPRRGN